MTRIERSKCPICDKDNSQILFKCRDYRYRVSNEEFALVKCHNCGLIYLNPQPSSAQIGNFYPQEYYSSRLSSCLNILFLGQMVREIKQYKTTGRLLDIGCGTGEFLLAMKNQGFEALGIDVSQNACHQAQKNGLKVINKELSEAHFPNQNFDVITLWHVFEHLREPALTLEEIRRVLKDDGLLLIETPNIDSLSFMFFKKYHFQLDVPRHLYFWSPKTIKQILEQNGFRIMRTEDFTLAFPLSLFHSFSHLLYDKKVEWPLSLMLLLSLSPFLIALTIFSRLVPKRGEILRIYCRKA